MERTLELETKHLEVQIPPGTSRLGHLFGSDLGQADFCFLICEMGVSSPHVGAG